MGKVWLAVSILLVIEVDGETALALIGKDGNTLATVGLEMFPSSPITGGLIICGRTVEVEVIGEEGDDNVGDPLKSDIDVEGCNWFISELFSIADPEFKNGRILPPVVRTDSRSPLFTSVSFFTF